MAQKESFEIERGSFFLEQIRNEHIFKLLGESEKISEVKYYKKSKAGKYAVKYDFITVVVSSGTFSLTLEKIAAMEAATGFQFGHASGNLEGGMDIYLREIQK